MGSVIHNRHHRKFVYKENDKNLCILSYFEHPDKYEIKTIVTSPDYRKNGYAGLVIDDFLIWAQDNNKDVVLTVIPLSDDITEDILLNFYKKHGFIHDDTKMEDIYLIHKV